MTRYGDLPRWITPATIIGSGGFAFVFPVAKGLQEDLFICKALYPWRSNPANLLKFGSKAVYAALFERGNEGLGD